MITTVKTTNTFANGLIPAKPILSPGISPKAFTFVEAPLFPLPSTTHYLAAFTQLRFGQNEKNLGNGFTLALTHQQLNDILNTKTKTIELNPKAAYDKLSPANKRALVHLVKAASILDNVFLKQDHPKNIEVKAALEKAANADNSLAQKTLTLFTIFNGLEGKNLYAKKSEPLRLFENQQLQPGKGFYPPKLQTKQLIDYIVQHPAEASSLLGNNTMVRWDEETKAFIADPYSVAFRQEMQQAAQELLLAAQATDHRGFAHYLRRQAQALVNDSDPQMPFDADKAWIELKGSPLHFTIGRECYDDRVSGEVAADPRIKPLIDEHEIITKVKDSIGVRVGIVNSESNAEIQRYRQHLKGFSKEMPLCDQYKQQSSSKMNFSDVDLVALSGSYAEARDGLLVAQNLPNDDKLSVQLKAGSHLAFHRQIRQSVDPPQQQAFLNALVDPAQHHWYKEDADFRFTVGHELAHSLGPRLTREKRDKISALGPWGDMLEENKADVASLVMTDYLVRAGALTPTEANEIYLTWAAMELPSKQPESNEAHRSRSLMQLNYFREKGAIHLEKGHPLRIVPDKMADTAKQMLQEVIQLQLDGNSDNAEAFVKKYTVWNDALDYVVEERLKLNPKRYKFLQQTLRDKLLKQYDKLPAYEKQLH